MRSSFFLEEAPWMFVRRLFYRNNWGNEKLLNAISSLKPWEDENRVRTVPYHGSNELLLRRNILVARLVCSSACVLCHSSFPFPDYTVEIYAVIFVYSSARFLHDSSITYYDEKAVAGARGRGSTTSRRIDLAYSSLPRIHSSSDGIY